jgi:raffinose/stachyose/melibiose transport system permease protein
LLLIVGVPLVMNLGISFTKWPGIGAPKFIGLKNYQALLHDSEFWSAFAHSVAFIFAVSIIPTFVGLVLAAALFDYIAPRFGERTSSGFRAGFYLPQILPVAVAGVLFTWILNPLGVLNTILEAVGLGSLAHNWLGDPSTALFSVMAVCVWLQLGYSLVIFMAGLSRVDPSLYEAADLDGANWGQRFRHITLPQLRPEIFVVLLTTTIAALKVFAPVYVLTNGGPDGATTVPSYLSYQNFFTTNFVGYGAAIATILTIIVTIVAIIALRYQTRLTEEG